MDRAPQQNRTYKAVKIGLFAPIPILAIVLFVAASEAGTHHSILRGLITAVIYLAVIIPTSIYIMRKRRSLAETNVTQRSFGRRLR
jgi:hypothetical protein